jgi:hypothetical protein
MSTCRETLDVDALDAAFKAGDGVGEPSRTPACGVLAASEGD